MTGNTGRSIIAFVLVAAAALAGCGGVAEQDDTLTGAAVLQATRAAETARTTVNATMAMGDFTVTLDGTGVENFARTSGSTKYKMKTEGSMPGGGGPDDEGAAFAPEATYEVRWFDDLVYIDAFSTDAMPGGRRWTKIDMAEMTGDEDCATSPSSQFGLGMGTPINALDVLAANGNVLENLGTEVVRDEATTHWRIEDPKAPPGCDETFGRVVLELWTDTDKRARRILVTLDAEPKRGATTTTTPDWFPAMRMTMTTDYFDFGAPVSITEPPKNEVWDMNDDASSGAVAAVDPTPADYGAPGPWIVAAEGMREGKPWRVWTTKTSTGARCFDVENTPTGPFAMFEPDSGALQHEGRPATCESDSGSFLTSMGGFGSLADVTDAGERTIVGFIEGESAQLVFANGQTAAMTVNLDTHIAQWRGTPPKGSIEVKTESGTCQLGFDLSKILDPSKPDMKSVTDQLADEGVPCIGSLTTNLATAGSTNATVPRP